MFKAAIFFLILSFGFIELSYGQQIKVYSKTVGLNIQTPVNLNVITKRILKFVTERLGFCTAWFKYISVDDFLIAKLTLANLKLGDTVKVQFFHTDFGHNMSFTGSLLPDESPEEVLIRLRSGLPISYRIDFPPSIPEPYVPLLEKILINDKEFCAATSEISKKRLTLQHTLEIVNGTLPVFRYNINIPFFAKTSTCGLDDTEITSNGISPYIYGGTIVRRGEYPWLAAIYLEQINATNLICGGSLLTSRLILSAAHCFTSFNTETDRVIVHLGRYNLTDAKEPDAVVREIETIIYHPDFKLYLNFSDADLALLKMYQPVSFSQNVKPICLWSESADETLIANHVGIIAGWGSEGNGATVSDVPKKVKTNIVSESECLRSLPIYSAITSSRTFCAGKRDGSGPCTGDSGGGLMINRNGRWVLRGVISAGLTAKARCNLHEYTVYCDLAKHLTWLEQYIGTQDQPITGRTQDICGILGDKSEKAYPWLVAIYGRTSTGLIFLCTGTLISSRSILAAADCFELKEDKKMQAENLKVFLGRYDLGNMKEKRVVTREIVTIFRHLSYKFKKGLLYDYDLALLQMDSAVSFTQYIKPICLWMEPAEKSEILGQMATLLSYDIRGIFNDTITVPLSKEVGIVDMAKCQLAGYNGDTVTRFLCTPRFGNNVDGILMLKRNGQWFLRGLSTANLFFTLKYNSRNYRVYTDLADYYQWIDNYLYT